MSRCRICGLEDLLNYQCKHCGGVYCSKHMLPENHQCSDLPYLHPPAWEPKEATYPDPPPVARTLSYGEYRNHPHLLQWLRRHKRASYVMVGLALFLSSWVLGTTRVEYSSFFAGLSVLFLLGVVFPCMIGHDAFGIRYRPVEISETEYSEGGRWTRTHVRIKGKSITKSYHSMEMQTPVLRIIMVVGLIGLVFLPVCLGVPILALFLPVGAGLLGLGCFGIFTEANMRFQRFTSKIRGRVLP